MARWYKEKYDPNNPEHQNKMAGCCGSSHDDQSTDHPTLIPVWVYFVSVSSFLFVFRSLGQLHDCLEFYSTKILPSRAIKREVIGSADSWEVQRWYDRLPLYLREEPRRLQVVKALSKALDDFRE